jgi:hypothetical protein
MKKIAVVTFFLMTVCAVQAQAAGDASFFVGYLNPGDLNLANVQGALKLNGTVAFGGRFEFDFAKILGVEQNIAFSPSIFDNNAVSGTTLKDARGLLYSSNLVINAPIRRFVPFATAGVGLVHPFNLNVNSVGTKFAINYGGGVKLERLAGPVGLRFDVRGWTAPDIFKNTLNMLEVSGGVVFTWGKKK